MKQPHRITLEKIKTLLPKNPIIIEAGARFGKDTAKMCALWPQGHIHAFEPVPRLFEQLQEKANRFENLSCYPYALSNNTGKKKMFISGGFSDACSSLLKPKECLIERPNITFEKDIIIPTITLDQWAVKYTIDHVDFMWLDLQGAELMALQRAETFLKTVRVIHIEVNLAERYENVPLAHHIKEFLTDCGFKLLEEDYHHATWGDALFIKI